MAGRDVCDLLRRAGGRARSARDIVRRSLTDRLRSAVDARIGPLRHLPALFRLAWATSRTLTLLSVGLRIARAAVPALMLYVAKLVVDTVVAGRADPAQAGSTSWFSGPCSSMSNC